MPALFSLGQHPALQAVQAQLQDGERLFAFLDVYAVCFMALAACTLCSFFDPGPQRKDTGLESWWRRSGGHGGVAGSGQSQ